ncbi:MAG TPA: hypothetical protein VHY08_08790 [Bacillota bacterium]|nr:hypothetical protein [Bacillota bacterium]
MKMKLGRISILLFISLSLIIINGCFLLPERDGYVKILVYSGEPNSPSAVVNAMETLFVGIDGLKPFERYNIKILSSGGQKIAEYALNATEDGKLPPTPMWPEAGLLPETANNGPADPGGVDLQVGSYKITLTGPKTDVTFPFSVIMKNAPVIWSSDNLGQISNSFQATTANVYVTGRGFEADKNVDIYIMRDKDFWSDGEILNDSDVYVNFVTAHTDPQSGKLGPVDLGVAAIDVLHGNCVNFDIIVDANQNGILDDKDAVDSLNSAGYTVQRPPAPVYRTFQIASNGKALDYVTHWNDKYYYPDTFNKDGSGTGFPWAGFGRGVFCILNPFIDETDLNTHLVYWSQVQVWVLTLTDFLDLINHGYDLTGKDVSDPLGRPDLVTVQRTCSNGAGSILIWQAPLINRRTGLFDPTEAGNGYVVIIEKPDSSGVFDNIYNPNEPNADFIDGVLTESGPPYQGFRVNDVP